MAKSRARRFADIISGAEQVPAESLDNASVTAISDQTNTSTGYFDLPSGTSAQRPSSATEGATRFNTESGSVEFYNGNIWISTNLTPSITSVNGDIYTTLDGTLTLNVINSTDIVDIKFYENDTLLTTLSNVVVSNGAFTVNTPSQVLSRPEGSVIEISIFNRDGTPSSNSISKTVIGLPSGGSITTSGGYRYHAFSSSGTLTVPSGFSRSCDYLCIAGAGGGGADSYSNRAAGGGGAGGYLAGSTTLSSTQTIIIGAGGAGGIAPNNSGYPNGYNGGNSSISGFSVVSIGGGGGGGHNTSGNISGNDGGSGGGGSNGSSTNFGRGTAGQGHDGKGSNQGGGGFGLTWLDGLTRAAGGGGAGSDGQWWPGGGGGASPSYQSDVFTGGGSGAGNGGNSGGVVTGGNGVANTGSGGGASRETTGGSGGSGIVIIRYAV